MANQIVAETVVMETAAAAAVRNLVMGNSLSSIVLVGSRRFEVSAQTSDIAMLNQTVAETAVMETAAAAAARNLVMVATS